MKYVNAKESDVDRIFELVNDTIKDIYPKYYPQEVVDFFCELHSRENIIKDVHEGTVGLLIDKGELIGTGSYKDNHITRVYVKTIYQGQGYGSYIMQILEDNIAFQYEEVYLDASLPASHLYEKRGYITQRHDKWLCKNGAILVYEIMKKKLSKQTKIFTNNNLIDNLSKLHTTPMGIQRIKRNLKKERNDVVAYCKEQIEKESAIIERKGKN